MAQYAAGKKFPSLQRAKEIEKAIHDLGRDLLKVKIAVKGVRAKKNNGIYLAVPPPVSLAPISSNFRKKYAALGQLG